MCGDNRGYVPKSSGEIVISGRACAPLDRKPGGIITCLTKAENSKPWRPVVRPNRYGWIWIVANTVFIVFGWTTRVWNNCPLNRSNGRKTSWETNAASGVCVNHHPRNCKSRGVITWLAKTYRCPINPTTRTRIPLINSHAWTGLNVYCYRPFCSSMGACFSEGSYCHMARTKLSWEPNLSITCMGNIAHTPLYCETRGVITWP